MDHKDCAVHVEEYKSKVIFSIIVPIYNTPNEYFKKCMNSLMNQTLQDIEIILVDDGSNSLCAQLCDEYAGNDYRVKVLHQANQGVSVARNNGIAIAIARGEWIAFVDADDWLDGTSFEELNQILESIENAEIVDVLLFDLIREGKNYSNTINFEFKDSCVYNMNDLSFKEEIYKRVIGIPKKINGQPSTIWYSCGKLYRSSFLRKNEIVFPMGIKKSEDKIFVARCFEKMNGFLYCKLPLYHYWENQSSVCHRYSEDLAKDRIKMAEILSEIACRMNSEIADLRKDKTYSGIDNAYMRFLFGITSDVLLLQFYHPNNPKPRNVNIKETNVFLNTEPFRKSIKSCKYRDLPKSIWIKKYMLQHGMLTPFVTMKKIEQMISQIKRRNNHAKTNTCLTDFRGGWISEWDCQLCISTI